MEDSAELLEAAVKQAREAKEELQEIANQTGAISDVIFPALTDHIQTLRNMRFSLTNEANQCMQSLKDIRKFFFDSDYHTEMERLREFVTLVKQLKDMQSDGSLDAITDAMLKLAVGGTDNERK